MVVFFYLFFPVSSPDNCRDSVAQLSNHLFEELAMDVYDEVDRRETDAG